METKLKRIPWISLLKGIVVLCAFLAFCISIRQKEFERFADIKPIFGIDPNKASREFSLSNYGGTAFFIGGSDNFESTPRQYTVLPNINSQNINLQKLEMKFTLKDGNDNLSTTYLYWRDADLNTYKMKIGINKGEYFIDGPPRAKRSEVFYTMSWHWLDWVLSNISQKEWFVDFEVPKNIEKGQH